MTTARQAATKRRELGDFLRAHRARLTPASLGLPAGGRRRTPGLRREEVAQSCGMSATWYTWLEQGRDVSASATALSTLARTLQLTPAERTYLFELAGKRDPSLPEPQDDDGMDAPASLGRAVAAIDGPAYILDSLWNARAWNRQAARLFVGWLDSGSDAPQSAALRFPEPDRAHGDPRLAGAGAPRAGRIPRRFRPPSRRRNAAGPGRRSAPAQPLVRPVLERTCRDGPHGRRADLRPPAPGPPPLRAGRLRGRQPSRLQACHAGQASRFRTPAGRYGSFARWTVPRSTSSSAFRMNPSLSC